ncbi:hypothetical protein BC829DRAFT_414518 [Chytridium lagenaria]|nr:hypothetical protein BC829DRAFT_414518 [Chytridium lagenaria]
MPWQFSKVTWEALWFVRAQECWEHLKDAPKVKMHYAESNTSSKAVKRLGPLRRKLESFPLPLRIQSPLRSLWARRRKNQCFALEEERKSQLLAEQNAVIKEAYQENSRSGTSVGEEAIVPSRDLNNVRTLRQLVEFNCRWGKKPEGRGLYCPVICIMQSNYFKNNRGLFLFSLILNVKRNQAILPHPVHTVNACHHSGEPSFLVERHHTTYIFYIWSIGGWSNRFRKLEGIFKFINRTVIRKVLLNRPTNKAVDWIEIQRGGSALVFVPQDLVQPDIGVHWGFPNFW